MDPEEFLRLAQQRLAPKANFNQRYAGDVYSTFKPSPNVEDRTMEDPRSGGLGALKAEMLKRMLEGTMPGAGGGTTNVPKSMGIPPIGTLAPPTAMGNELGAGDLRDELMNPGSRPDLYQNIFPPDDPAATIVDDYIGNAGGEV